MLFVIHAGRRVPVEGDRFVIGRAQAAQLRLASDSVARSHAVIERVDGRYFMVDLGSTNGLYFRGERFSRRPIEHGDRFEIGREEIELAFE